MVTDRDGVVTGNSMTMQEYKVTSHTGMSVRRQGETGVRGGA